MFQAHHVALSVENLDQTLEFYAKLEFVEIFRWQAEDQSLRIVHLRLNNFILELFHFSENKNLSCQSSNTELDTIGTKHFALSVDSIEQAKRYCIDEGLAKQLTITQGRTDIAYFFLTDPNGIPVEIVQDQRNLKEM